MVFGGMKEQKICLTTGRASARNGCSRKKKNGVFRARLVAKGYDQIAGVNFQYNFALVTSEITLRILLILSIIDDLYAEIADV